MTPAWLAALAVLTMAWPAAPRVARHLVPPDDPFWLVGRTVRGRSGRRGGVARDRLVGRAVVAAVVGVVVHPLLALPAGFVVFVHDVAGRRRRAAELQAAVGRELPELIDLVAVALAGGGSVHAAVELVSRRPIGPVSERFASAMVAVERGERLADVLDRVAEDLGDQVRPLIRNLTGAEHYGTSIESTLDRLAVEARAQRRRTAEMRARRVPVRLLGPLVLGILPAFVLLTVVPTVARTIDDLSLGGPP